VDYAPNQTAGAALLEEVGRAHEAAIGRLPGLHVTDLVMCRRKAWYRLHGYPAEERSAESNLQMLLGTAFGALLEAQRNSEVSVVLDLDGTPVHGTIDILELQSDGAPVRVVEIKESRSSSTKSLAKLGYYTEQVAAYCLATGLQAGRLHICHLLGDWRAAKRPMLNTWDLYFSGPELAAWYEELRQRAAQVLHPLPPSVDHTHWNFECEGCSYHEHCPGGQGYDMGWFTPQEELVAWQ
jgi:CRISPR/Cas system-associated exonuclease Cas4 (RecB family)